MPPGSAIHADVPFSWSEVASRPARNLSGTAKRYQEPQKPSRRSSRPQISQIFDDLGEKEAHSKNTLYSHAR